jgi:hypothetical protein
MEMGVVDDSLGDELVGEGVVGGAASGGGAVPGGGAVGGGGDADGTTEPDTFSVACDWNAT